MMTTSVLSSYHYLLYLDRELDSQKVKINRIFLPAYTSYLYITSAINSSYKRRLDIAPDYLTGPVTMQEGYFCLILSPV